MEPARSECGKKYWKSGGGAGRNRSTNIELLSCHDRLTRRKKLPADALVARHLNQLLTIYFWRLLCQKYPDYNYIRPSVSKDLIRLRNGILLVYRPLSAE
jgi:hypothetical protein